MKTSYKKFLAIFLSVLLIATVSAVAIIGATASDNAVDEAGTTAEGNTDVIDETTTPDEPDYWILGDLDCDGKITANDARIALRLAAKLPTPDKKAPDYVGDIDVNGKINAIDARMILRVAARLSTFDEIASTTEIEPYQPVPTYVPGDGSVSAD